MSYIQGFVAAVPEANKEAYRKHAADAFLLFREFGVLRMVESWEDDVQDGTVTDLRRAVKAEPGEKIVFSWLEYASKEAADTASQKMMEDPRMEQFGGEMPFDGKRMIFGGFETVSDVGAADGTGYVSGMVAAAPSNGKESYRDFARNMARRVSSMPGGSMSPRARSLISSAPFRPRTARPLPLDASNGPPRRPAIPAGEK